MSKTHIEWTEHTWNPIVSGCHIISEGCTNCYAMTMANRLEAMGQDRYKGLTRKTAKGNIIWNGKVNIDMNDKALYKPLQRKKPTMYFVNSMTDLFHEDVPFEAVDKIMAVIALCPQHTFQVLTKRADRMKEYFDYQYRASVILSWCNYLTNAKYTDKWINPDTTKIPLPNLWLGVSVENQEQADKRIPYLLETPAKLRFLSCEPLLENINFKNETHFEGKGGYDDPDYQVLDFLKGTCFLSKYDVKNDNDFNTCQLGGKIDWVIVGGESGHNARPMHPNWVRSIKDQCKDANVPFFFKQWGEYLPLLQKNNVILNLKTDVLMNEYGETNSLKYQRGNYIGFAKVGKKASGCLLDGVEYKEMPKL